MLYRCIRNILAVVYRIVFRFEIIGSENIPKDGGVILCGNHRSNNDAIFLAICQNRNISFMAKDNMFKFPLIGYIIRKLDAFPVKRGSGDIGAVRTAVDVLKKGKLLCIFPEGTRNKTTEALLPFKTGAAFIAYKSGAGIVPCAISGKIRIFSKIRVAFGEPMYVVKPEEGKPDIDKETEKLKERIYELYQRS